MMRYLVHRVGPAHALGFGCVVGVILGLLPVLGMVATALLIQAGQAEILRALGPLGSILTPRLNVSWNVVGLTGLVLPAWRCRRLLRARRLAGRPGLQHDRPYDWRPGVGYTRRMP